MYDKCGNVLRVETTINDVYQFKTFRAPESKPDAPPRWQFMRKGVADLHRRAEVAQACNDRYLTALASVENTTSLGELAAGLCRPVTHKGRRVRALSPHAPADATLLMAISRGEFTLNGLRNQDLRRLLFARPPRTETEQKRQAAAISRKLLLAASAPPDPQGAAHAPLPPDRCRPHCGHRAPGGAQRKHAGTDEDSSISKSSRFAGIFGVSSAEDVTTGLEV